MLFPSDIVCNVLNTKDDWVTVYHCFYDSHCVSSGYQTEPGSPNFMPVMLVCD